MRKTAKIGSLFFSLLLGFITAWFVAKTSIIETLLPGMATGVKRYYLIGTGSLLFGVIFYLFFLFLWNYGAVVIANLAEGINKRPPNQVIGGTVGLLIGLTMAFFISRVYEFITISFLSTFLAVGTFVFMGYLGLFIGMRFPLDLSQRPDLRGRFAAARAKSGQPKVLDTSAIIDGRIVDICHTGFIEGELFVPEFVLKELQAIADSSDDLTRLKGRRGLDLVKELQQQPAVTVTISAKDYEDVQEVDIKLLRLAKDLKGAVITTDYNLNKVASVQSIRVLNVNDLSNAVKPNAIPGESFVIDIIKKGKEADQGVGYLPDGTMIVVEKGKNRIGEELMVEVTSVLQTPAGRMIFAKVRE